MVLSLLPDIIYFPLELIATECTFPLCPFSVFIAVLVDVSNSQTFIVQSSLPETMYLLFFGLIATDLTGFLCPVNSLIYFPFSRSHILIVLSQLPETIF